MYSSVKEADSYISTHYTSKSAAYKRWNTLSEDDKAVYLNNAFDSIECLKFGGRKAVPEQETAFPRLPYQYGHTDSGAPERVKSAEIELALYLSDEKKQESSEKRSKLIADGVKSFSLGDLSESYGDNVQSASKSSVYDCKKAVSLLSPYLSAGFEIC